MRHWLYLFSLCLLSEACPIDHPALFEQDAAPRILPDCAVVPGVPQFEFVNGQLQDQAPDQLYVPGAPCALCQGVHACAGGTQMCLTTSVGMVWGPCSGATDGASDIVDATDASEEGMPDASTSDVADASMDTIDGGTTDASEDVLIVDAGVDVELPDVPVDVLIADVAVDTSVLDTGSPDVPLDVPVADVGVDAGTLDVGVDVPIADVRPDVVIDTGVDTGVTPPPDVPVDTGVDVPCPSGMTRCSGTCIGTTSDIHNCGGCSVSCPMPMNTTATCAASACGFTCNTNFADCDHVASNGCEINMQTSAANCGACGTVCAAPTGGTASCVAGRCTTACPSGHALCGGACVDTTSDPSNCGGCGIVCSAGAPCSLGACAQLGVRYASTRGEVLTDMLVQFLPDDSAAVNMVGGQCVGGLQYTDSSHTTAICWLVIPTGSAVLRFAPMIGSSFVCDYSTSLSSSCASFFSAPASPDGTNFTFITPTASYSGACEYLVSCSPVGAAFYPADYSGGTPSGHHELLRLAINRLCAC